jgi:hypothetical protein
MEVLDAGTLLIKRAATYFASERDPSSLLLISEPVGVNEVNPAMRGDWKAAWALAPDGLVRMYPVTMLKALYEAA